MRAELIERRTIDELLARYEFEPTLKDIFVEGPQDQAFIDWVSSECCFFDLRAYEIATIDVPSSIVQSYKLESNHRGRMITLALELASRGTESLYHTAACLADADFMYLMGVETTSPLLIFTDFTALELYLFDESAISKLLRLILGRSALKARDILAAITPLLVDLFLVRAAAHQMGIKLSQIQWRKCCTLSGHAIEFDQQTYVDRFISRDGHAKRKDEFLAKLRELKAIVPSEARSCVHGHDFLEVLHWYLSKAHNVGGLPNLEHFTRFIFGTLDIRAFRATKLHAELKARFCVT